MAKKVRSLTAAVQYTPEGKLMDRFTPIKWGISIEDTEVSAHGVKVVIYYHQDGKKDKKDQYETSFCFTQKELAKINPHGDNKFAQVNFMKSLSRDAIEKLRADIDQAILEVYYRSGPSAAVSAIENDRHLGAMLEQFALLEAKKAQMFAPPY